MRLSFCLLIGGFVALTALACASPDRVFADGGGLSNPCSTDAQCATGICADGKCCDRACNGQCEACDVKGSEGKCSLVTGTPHAPRSICPGDGSCAGKCNGSSTACTFADAKTICGAACDGKCNGAGTCNGSSGSACPNGFACGATACLTSCAAPADCQTNFVCKGSACERVPESDCLDGVDNNGDKLTDCQDPTCNVSVECVVAVPSGELGVRSQDGTCPTSYPTTEVFHTGLKAGTCSGCACQSQCSATVTLYTGTTCNSGATPVAFTGPPTGMGGDVVCKAASGMFKSGTVTAAAPSGCVGSGTATQSAPTWTTNDTFCGAKTSATCGDAAKVGVAKHQTDPLCVRVGAAESCPAAFTSGTNGTFFTSFTLGTCGSCASCTKSPTNMCKATLLTPQVLTGMNCTGSASILDNSCGSLNQGSYSSVEMGFAKNGTDNCTSSVTSNPPTPSGGVRICCQ